jgi:hypothetical protein
MSPLDDINRNENFQNSLLDHRIKCYINDLIQKVWIGEFNQTSDSNSINPQINKNIHIGKQRLEHKANQIYFFKRIFSFLHKDHLKENKNELYFRLDFKSKLNVNNVNDLVSNFVFSCPYQMLITLAIILNSIMLAIQTDDDARETYELTLRCMESFSNAVFLIEFVLKLSISFKLYWLNAWNLFDFVLLIVGLASILVNQTHFESAVDASKIFRIIRVFRALRSLRSINILSRMQIIANTFFKSIFDMINMVILMLLTMIMFSLFGCSIFADTNEIKPYFENLDTGMLTLFYCATRESLSGLFNALENSDEFWFVLFWKLFLVGVIILFAFVLTNLIVAIVVTNMEKSLKDYEKSVENEMQIKLIEGSDRLPKNDNKDEWLETIDVKDIVKGWIL